MGKEKKEIGMEKLIELLNEYEIWKGKNGLDIRQEYAEHNFKYNKYLYVRVISKKYGFIKWLVDNDKIDFEGMSGHGKIISYLTDEKDYKWNDIKEGVILMLISISNSPIDFLCEILK